MSMLAQIWHEIGLKVKSRRIFIKPRRIFVKSRRIFVKNSF